MGKSSGFTFDLQEENSSPHAIWEYKKIKNQKTKYKGKHIITTELEHSYNIWAALILQKEGYEVAHS